MKRIPHALAKNVIVKLVASYANYARGTLPIHIHASRRNHAANDHIEQTSENFQSSQSDLPNHYHAEDMWA
jgi:predicted choloylglycine hydrolase